MHKTIEAPKLAAKAVGAETNRFPNEQTFYSKYFRKQVQVGQTIVNLRNKNLFFKHKFLFSKFSQNTDNECNKKYTGAYDYNKHKDDYVKQQDNNNFQLHADKRIDDDKIKDIPAFAKKAPLVLVAEKTNRNLGEKNKRDHPVEHNNDTFDVIGDGVSFYTDH